MNLYTVYIEDDRHSALPTMDILTAVDDEQVRAQGQPARPASSPHYRSIAVWEENRLVCELPEPGEGEELKGRRREEGFSSW